MWTPDNNFSPMGFSTPPPAWRSARSSPVMPGSERSRTSPQAEADLFHVVHKVPAGDSPYVRAKHVQLVDKDPSKAISMFWAAINSGDRVESALKDMAVVMKQLNRSEEAIEAIKSFRHLCPIESQESLDNLLVELYKRSCRIEEQIEVLQVKLKHIEEGIAFGGKRTKTGRSQGKKIQITIEQEYSRVLGNLAWAYLQQNNYKLAEELYRKALSLEQDKNKQCNLAICLMHMNRMTEAKFLLQTIRGSSENGQLDESYAKSFERAIQMLAELESRQAVKPGYQEESQKEPRTPFSSFISSNSDHHENNNNFVGSDKGSSKCTSFGQRNGSQSMFADKLRQGYERRADFGCKRNDNWASRDGVEADFARKNAYASPVPVGRSPKVPFTQPRRCSWSFNNGVQRRGWVQEDDANVGCCRKLSFEQTKNSKNVLQANKNIDGDWRKASRGDHDKVNSESIIQTCVNGDWKGISWENDEQKKVLAKEFNLPTESPVAVDYFRAKEAFSDENCDQSSNISTDGSVRLTETVAENLNETQEFQSQSKSVKDLSTCRSKKSWADMVEEDEQELLSGTSDNFKNKFMFPSQNSISDDENADCNIIHGTPTPLNQIEKLNLNRKIELLGLKDGYYTQPKNAAPTMNNRGVHRSLCFDQHQKPYRDENSCSSPLSKKALNFEGERECASGNGIKIMRRNRLQVFRDITLLSESPRP